MEEDLIWKNVKLVKYDEKYFEYIYATYQDYNSRFLFTNDLVIESKKEMWNKLDKKIHTYYNEFMIIINVSNDLPVGFIYGYDYNTLNGYIYLAIYIDEKSRNNVIGAEAGMLFLNYLVEKYPIRKVYCTVYEYNKPSFKMLKNAGFKTEGVLKEHRYFNGKYHNMYIVSLEREGVLSLKERLKFDIKTKP